MVRPKHTALYSLSFLFLFCSYRSYCQLSQTIFKAAGSPLDAKVQVQWNRYYDSEGLFSICKKIAKMYPSLAKLASIGKSYEGRDIWCLTITDFKTENPIHKPGLYIQGNIHGNELQGSEYALYTAWYLTENYRDSKYFKDLLASTVFYIVPTINPDGRDNFIHKPNSADAGRYSVVRKDLDGDGKFGEDDYNDLDKDGSITRIIKKDPYGAYVIDSNFTSRLLQYTNGDDSLILNSATGFYRSKYPSRNSFDLMPEGHIDDDKDGKFDEDGTSYISMADIGRTARKNFNLNDYDLNRNWKYSWRDKRIDSNRNSGTSFSFPETIAARAFFFKHPNIVIAQCLHNDGGEIYPATANQKDRNEFTTSNDKELYDYIGNQGERILPSYKYKNDNFDSASIGGSTGRAVDWMFGKRGIYAFIIELNPRNMFYNSDSGKLNSDMPLYQFNKDYLFDDPVVEWHNYKHPVLGDVLIGGFKKNYPRLTPGFCMEYEAHKNMSFSIYLSSVMPRLKLKQLDKKDIGNGLLQITAIITNEGLLPTHSGPDLKHNITPPDRIVLETTAEVIQSGVVKFDLPGDSVTIDRKENNKQVQIYNIEGHGKVVVRWIVKLKGGETYQLIVNSIKGGTLSKKFK